MNERRGGLYWLVALAVSLIVVAVILSVMRREAAEPFVLGLLTLFAVVGILALFGAVAGALRFGNLDESALFASLLPRALDEGLVVTSSDQRVVYANEAYRKMSCADERCAPSSVPRTFAVSPEANDPMYRLAQAAREGRNWKEEFRVSMPGGQEGVHWYRISVHPLGSLPSVVWMRGEYVLWRVADITAERDSQEDVFQELQQAIDYLDHAPIGFFSSDADGSVRYMNATLACWLGLDLVQTVPSELMVADIVVGDTAALLVRAEPTPGEVCTETLDLDLRRRDGTSLPVRLLHGVSFTADGRHSYSRTVVINRRQGEDASEDLRAAEVRFARFFNNAPIAIATVDDEGRIIRANSVFAHMQKLCAERLGANPLLLRLLDEKSHPAIEEALCSARHGKSDIAPVDAFLSCGDDLSVRLFVSPVRDNDEGRDVALVYAIDTTAQRALELQFAQSQKMQAVGQLAGGIAHDFNNVLTAIIGNSDLLLSSHRATDPAFQEIMSIKNSANRAASLVRQLLAFSRRQTLQPEVLRLSDALSEVTAMLRRLLDEAIVFDVDYGGALWLVKADLTQLEQVIINLVLNARDAMSDGGRIALRISNVSAQDVEGLDLPDMPTADYVAIEVSDTGSGMGDEVIGKIFEPFFSTKEVGKGTGLGLSMVYGIVKQTGGFIFPESKPGQGTLFRIFLPRYVPDSSDEAIKMAEDKPAMEADTTGSGIILLVEDEDAVRTFASRALSSRGYTVLEAATGLKALELLEANDNKVDLVVSDVVMPEMDGPALLRELRSRIPDIKIIFMSGYAEDAFQKSPDADMQFTFLQKPFNLKELAVTVKRVIREERKD